MNTHMECAIVVYNIKKYLSTLIRTHAPPKQLIRLLYIIRIERAAP